MFTPPDDIIASIRKRPGMYVGDVHDQTGLHHVLWEIVGNAVDEHLAGFCRRIEVTLHDGEVTVDDDGRGISVEPLPDGTPALVHVLENLHDRPTFDGHLKHVHLDGMGLGLVVVNATSRAMVVETTRAGRRHRYEARAGVPLGPIVELGPSAKPGTRITFAPDPEIFSRVSFDAALIRDRLEEIAAFCPGLTTCFADERRPVFSCPRGIVDLVARECLVRCGLPDPPLHASGERDGVRVEVALTWARQDFDGQLRSFVNLYETREGGSHVTGLQCALEEIVTEMPQPAHAHLVAALKERAVGIISVFYHDPTFDNPTRARLASPEVQPVVEEVVRRCLREFGERRPDELRRLVARVG